MQTAGKQWICYPSRSTTIQVYFVADIHLLSAACAEDKLAKDLDGIRDDPYAFWVGVGDYVDLVGYHDTRFDPDAVADSVSVRDLGQLGAVGYKRIHDLFKPISHKCLGLIQGNHERKYDLHTEQQHWTDWLCCELGVKNLGYCALFDVTLTRSPKVNSPKILQSAPANGANSWQVRFFAHHGAGFAQTPGGKMNRLVQFMNSFEADIYACGHVHDQIARRQPLIGANADCNKLVEKQRVGVITGSYLKTYAKNTTTYGEQRGYLPVNLGMAGVSLTPYTKGDHAAGGGMIKAEV